MNFSTPYIDYECKDVYTLGLRTWISNVRLGNFSVPCQHECCKKIDSFQVILPRLLLMASLLPHGDFRSYLMPTFGIISVTLTFLTWSCQMMTN